MIELRVVQFWSEIVLVTSNQTRAVRSFDFEITRMISEQIALHTTDFCLIHINIDTPSLGRQSELAKKGYLVPV